MIWALPHDTHSARCLRQDVATVPETGPGGTEKRNGGCEDLRIRPNRISSAKVVSPNKPRYDEVSSARIPVQAPHQQQNLAVVSGL